MIILGAGMAGLTAGNMLRRHKPIIYEAQSSLPNNHAALLRFRTDKVATATGIPFKKVKVQKAVLFEGELHNEATIAMQNKYSYKVTKGYYPRSIGSLEAVDRYIAPDNFIAQAAANIDIRYNQGEAVKLLIGEKGTNDVISTIPMNIMMELIDWKEKPEFKFLPIWSVSTDIKVPCDIYQTIYNIDGLAVYRMSITGSKLIIEYNDAPADSELKGDIETALGVFGIDSATDAPVKKFQKYGKLLPIDDGIRKRFMLHLTQNYGIYSLGRFATWRQILMDDVVQDVNIIENMITRQDAYSNNKHWSAK